ncbi:ATP-binding protein [filamentous cyanobacterium LEGE 11480]|uniref:ATP-binding protein n=1 Tax=Romeriopsis navalis LEGE 11480 TaxID=2777977 RepID=A0A928VNF3_9CYAN|nr:ATP-binding protein [Romeriopsis navalis]MBE9031530.1 ATP-binding protein [Romeriopsis navalis LEGE 11480]
MPEPTSTAKNPFTVGRPVSSDRFIGRASEIATALDQIISRGHLALWGGPGVGKTSLLNLLSQPHQWQVRGYDPTGAVFIQLSCLGISPFRASEFWREILQQLHDLVDPQIQATIAPKLMEAHPGKEDLRSVLRLLGRKKQYLVLMIDDYDAALQTSPHYSAAEMATLVSDCRNLCSHSVERAYLSMVITSLRRLNELGPKLQPGSSPWYNHYLFLPLKPFSDSDVMALMAGLPITPALRDGIREMSDGHPALLQNAGHLLYRELRSGNVPDLISFAQDFQTATTHLFEAQWNIANEIEQTLMMLIALMNLQGRLQGKVYDMGDLPVVFSQKERELLNLVDQGVLVQRGRSGELNFAFASSMLEWWVVEELENSSETWLTERQRIFLNLMSHRQAQIVTTAIHWLWQNKDELPSIIEWLAKVSSAFPKGLIP